jgi:hypothetical protein
MSKQRKQARGSWHLAGTVQRMTEREKERQMEKGKDRGRSFEL